MPLLVKPVSWTERIEKWGNRVAEKRFRVFAIENDLGLPISLCAFADYLLHESWESCCSAHLVWTAIYAYRRALIMDETLVNIRLQCARGLARVAPELTNWWGGSSPEFLSQLQDHACAPFELNDNDTMQAVAVALMGASTDADTPQLRDEGIRLLQAHLNIIRQEADESTDGPLEIELLQVATRIRYDSRHLWSDLDLIIQLEREALCDHGEDGPEGKEIVGNLAQHLLRRYMSRLQAGSSPGLDDIDECIQLCRRHLAADAERSALVEISTKLAMALYLRFEYIPTVEDLAMCVELARVVVDKASPEDANEGPCLAFAHLILARFEHVTGEDDTPEPPHVDQPGLVQAIQSLLPAAIDTDSGQDGSDRARNLLILSSAYTYFLNRPSDLVSAGMSLDLAMEALRAAEADTESQKWRGHCMFHLASLYLEPTATYYDLKKSYTYLKEAVKDQSSSQEERLTAAIGTLNKREAPFALMDDETRQLYLEVIVALMDILPGMAILGLDAASRLRALRAAERGILPATGHALLLDRVDMALEFNETCRSMFWTQLLRLRTPFEDLPAGSLRDQLHELTTELEKSSFVPISDFGCREPWQGDQETVRRRQMISKFNKLTEEARALPGFDRLLLPPTFEALACASEKGPVVLLVATESLSTCEAIVLSQSLEGKAQRVRLGLTRDGLSHLARDWWLSSASARALFRKNTRETHQRHGGITTGPECGHDELPAVESEATASSGASRALKLTAIRKLSKTALSTLR